MAGQSNEAPWYREGLRFTCTQCGNCCTGAPGYVFLTEEEATKIAQFLGLPDGQLRPDQIRKVGRRWSLTEHRNGDCVFLRTAGGRRTCSIYPVRPLQCRTWPFWNDNLDTPEDWAEAARGCPGMNHGNAVEYVRIEQVRTAKRLEDLPA